MFNRNTSFILDKNCDFWQIQRIVVVSTDCSMCKSWFLGLCLIVPSYQLSGFSHADRGCLVVTFTSFILLFIGSNTHHTSSGTSHSVYDSTTFSPHEVIFQHPYSILNLQFGGQVPCSQLELIRFRFYSHYPGRPNYRIIPFITW